MKRDPTRSGQGPCCVATQQTATVSRGAEPALPHLLVRSAQSARRRVRSASSPRPPTASSALAPPSAPEQLRRSRLICSLSSEMFVPPTEVPSPETASPTVVFPHAGPTSRSAAANENPASQRFSLRWGSRRRGAFVSSTLRRTRGLRGGLGVLGGRRRCRKGRARWLGSGSRARPASPRVRWTGTRALALV